VVLLAATVAALGPAACDEAEGRPTARPPSAAPAQLAATDPALVPAQEEKSAWPDAVTTLAESMAAHQDREQCVDSLRARLPVELAEVIADIGYDVLVDDVCDGLDALKQKSAERCDELSVAPVRNGCRRRIAIVEGAPELCPSDPLLPGREPVCVAWASRSLALCRTAASVDRERCEAVLRGDANRCPRTSQRGRCQAEVRRYSPSFMDEVDDAADAALESSFSVEVTKAGAPPHRIDLDLGRGVFLAAKNCDYEIELTPRIPSLPSAEEAALAITLRIGAGATTPLRLGLGPRGGAAIEYRAPGQPAIHGLTDGEGTVVIRQWSAERGAELAGDIDVTLNEHGLSGSFRTFVRDLDSLRDGCAPAP
jgi:hypothetical protein